MIEYDGGTPFHLFHSCLLNQPEKTARCLVNRARLHANKGVAGKHDYAIGHDTFQWGLRGGHRTKGAKIKENPMMMRKPTIDWGGTYLPI
jgi:hypothetical protein